MPGEPIGHVTATEQEELGWPADAEVQLRDSQIAGETRNRDNRTRRRSPSKRRNTTASSKKTRTALTAPIKIKAGNQWLSDLGDVCYVGSNEEPIVQHLTTGETEIATYGEKLHGSGGELAIFDQGNALYLHGVRPVRQHVYAVPAAEMHRRRTPKQSRTPSTGSSVFPRRRERASQKSKERSTTLRRK